MLSRLWNDMRSFVNMAAHLMCSNSGVVFLVTLDIREISETSGRLI